MTVDAKNHEAPGCGAEPCSSRESQSATEGMQVRNPARHSRRSRCRSTS